MNNLGELEKALGYTFQNQDILIQALTHRSYLNENPHFNLGHNERLEFYGDAILEDIVTGHLFHHYQDKNEGELTNLRAALVRGAHLAQVAEKISLDKYLNISNGERNDPSAKAYINANAIEALIAAMRIDGGYEIAQDFIDKFIIVDLEVILAEKLFIDAKSLLQEKIQEQHGITPKYEVVSEQGPDHNKTFEVAVYVGDKEYGRGIGPSKQKAEQDAAKNSLHKL